MDDTDKLKVLHEDALKMGLTFEPPDVNRGSHRFEPITDRSIRYGLGAIKGSGQQAIDAIVAAREGRGEGPNGAEVGPFKSLFDFCRRVDRLRLNKRTVEALIKAGGFDSIHLNRAELLASVERAFEFANACVANADQGGLFDAMGDDDHGSSTQEPDIVATLPWGVKERLTHEKTAMGFYFSGHLFDEVEREIRRIAKIPLDSVKESRDPVILAGIVTDMRVINGQRGKLALFKLDDKSAVLEVSADEALMNQHRNTLKDDELVIVQAVAQPDRFSGGLRLKIQQVWDLDAARCRFGKYLRVTVNGTNPAGTTGTLRWQDPQAHIPSAYIVKRKDQLGVFVQQGTGSDAKARFVPLPGAQEGRPSPAPKTLAGNIALIVQGQLALQDQAPIAVR
jgi:DNA polymerase-3 subunit alpha